jgi:hypothetical protein
MVAAISRFTICHVSNRLPLRIPVSKLIGQLNVSCFSKKGYFWNDALNSIELGNFCLYLRIIFFVDFCL